MFSALKRHEVHQYKTKFGNVDGNGSEERGEHALFIHNWTKKVRLERAKALQIHIQYSKV